MPLRTMALLYYMQNFDAVEFFDAGILISFIVAAVLRMLVFVIMWITVIKNTS